ncbi:MAG: Na+/H+ antiporter NhaC family protein, partial [Bacteroidales bacterium]|nr:Na+/H+ antiporter NhaC family protein [Bacteroidales bacterium]
MTRNRGFLALSPLLVFLGVYLVSSFLAKDFYKVPVVSAFLIASVYALAISKGKGLEERVAIFSRGAGDRNVLLMIWIFVLAGVFAATAKAIGSIDATVAFTLRILPGKFILVGLFLAACFISMAIGTSVGTIVALVPIASGLASGVGAPLPLIVAGIVGGAFFGDNLSFISDTTIASTRSQGCSMKDKFKANIWIAGPAAIVVALLYIYLGRGFSATPTPGEFNFLLVLPYLAVIVLALFGLNVLAVLGIGIGLNAIIGLALGKFGWVGFLESAGHGVASMGDLIIVTMLAGGMLEVIRENGGIDYIIHLLTKRISGRRGAEFSIAALVSLANICTANNTIAIITTGSIAK